MTKKPIKRKRWLWNDTWEDAAERQIFGTLHGGVKEADMTDRGWEEIYKKTGERLKKGLKIILGAVAAILVTAVLFWGAFVYRTRYKVTTVTTNGSPDGSYELVLQAVGEAAWPFGPADGRLILRDKKSEVAKRNFTIYDDGAGIREDSWEVAWHDDCVEVVLSGDEQSDEWILLYFDGRIEQGVDDGKQQKDWTHGEVTSPEADVRTVQGKDSHADNSKLPEETGKAEDREDFGGFKEAEESSGGLPQPYGKYLEALCQIMAEHTDPFGREYFVDGNLDFGSNRFAILDVDRDGSQEMIVNFNTSNMAGMCEVVYGYDKESGKWKEKMTEWVNNTYYSNGFVKASASHNHGKDPEARGIWPYSFYQYDKVMDRYRLRYDVRSWDGQVNPEEFPVERDTDGDGVVYCILEDGQKMEDGNAMIVDKEQYDNWVEEMTPEWCRLDIVYHQMTEEAVESIRQAYGQTAVYAPLAKQGMRQSAEEPFTTDYLLYDMDHNGSLELITNVMRGTGRYSENHFYGLADENRFVELPLVKLCNGERRDWVSEFDLFTWTYDKAYQDKSGVIYYEGNDFTREGIYGGYDETGFYYLKDGIVYQDSIRTCSRFAHSEGEEEEVCYYTMPMGNEDEAQEITKEQYEKIRDAYVEEMTPVNVYQNWVSFSQDELEKGGYSEEEIRLKLFESFLGSR